MLLKLALTLLLLVFGWRLVRLYQNLVQARAIGLPILITPFSWQEPLWLLIRPSVAFIQFLPFGLGSWYKRSNVDSIIFDNFKTHGKLGRAYTLVSPAANEIVLSDAKAATEVMSDFRHWRRPQMLYNLFRALGDPVNAMDGEDWQRHRKIISYGFKEGNNKIVWDVARKQAQQWLASVPETTTFDKVHLASETISMNVLMGAIFGQEYDFSDGGLDVVPQGHQKSFTEALHYMVQNIILVWILGNLNLPTWLDFGPLKMVRIMKEELTKYFDERLELRDGDLVKSLVEANENEKSGGTKKFLSKEELYGNLYLMNVAGFDTTAFTLSFSLALLALHQDTQEWARTALNSYDDFQHAVRLKAVMYETMRIYGTAPSMLRYSEEPRDLHIDGQTYRVPTGIFVASNFSGVHHDPKLWGDDAGVWRPQRWMEVIDGVEHLRSDASFIAWSVGPRVCPGKKFSQVEFVAAIGEVLWTYKLEPGNGIKESLDNYFWSITPKLKNPQSTSVKFIKR